MKAVTMHGEAHSIIAIMDEGPRQVAVMREGSFEEARKMAAANELLESCEELLDLYTETQDDVSTFHNSTINRARAAINKAKGE